MTVATLIGRIFRAARAANGDARGGAATDAVFNALFSDRSAEPAHVHRPDPMSKCRQCAEAGFRADVVADDADKAQR